MDRNSGDQSHPTRQEHNKVQMKSNHQSTPRNVSTASSVTEIAGFGSSDQEQSPSAALPTMSASTVHGDIVVKVEDESIGGQSVQICKRVKKEEYDEEYVVVECDCEECIGKIKVEEEEIEVKMEIEEDVKIPMKRPRMDRVPESDPTGPPSPSTVHSTNFIPVKIEYPDEHVTTSLINAQASTDEAATEAEATPSFFPSTVHTNITVKVEDESIGDRSVQHCKRVKKEEYDEEYVVVECDCGSGEFIEKFVVKEELDETGETDDRNSSHQSVHVCTQVKKEEGEDVEHLIDSDCEEYKTMVEVKEEFEEEEEIEVKKEIEEVEVKDEEHDRQVKREGTEPISDEVDGWMNDGRGDDAEEQEEDEQIGCDEQVGGIVGSLLNDQVNDGDLVNVIREEDDAMNVRLQVDQIEAQPNQEHLSDIDYELEMLRNVFVKPIENGQFGGQFLCDYPKCGKRFDEQKLLAHLKLHTKPFVCDVVGCLRRFTSPRALTVHLRSHTANLLECDLPGCVKRFMNVGTLNLHKRDHVNENVFICEWGDCDKLHYSLTGHLAHHLSHSDDGINEHQFVCDWAECARKFTTQLNLSIHRKLHTGESPFDIQHLTFACDLRDAKIAHLVTHQLSHVPNRSGDIQKVTVPTEPNFVKQIEPDQLGNKLECGYKGCGKRWKYKAQLIKHIRSHTGEKPFKCNWTDCDKAFNQASVLKAHIRTHTGERPFVCDECDAKFTTSDQLTIHRRTHTGERPYECDWPGCDQACSTSGNLALHRRTHTGEKPYACNVPKCGQPFVTLAQLNYHTQKVHTGKRFACDVKGCKKSYMTKYLLKDHKTQVHNRH